MDASLRSLLVPEPPEWLTEHLFGLVFESFGPLGLVALKVVAGLAIFALLLWHVTDWGTEILRGSLIVLLLFVPIFLGLRSIRPHLFTYLLLTLVLVLLLRSHGTEGRLLAVLPPIFLVWVNLHGGVLAGIGVIGLWGGVRVLRSLIASLRSRTAPASPHWAIWSGVVVASIAATLVNPYGSDLLAFLVETATVPRPYISEWDPLELRSRLGVMWLAAVTFTGWALLRAEARPPPEGLVVLAVLVLLPLTAVRHLPLLFAGIAVIGAPAFADLWGREDESSQPFPRRKGWLGAGLVGLSATVLWMAVETRDLACITIERSIFPVRATAWLQASGIEANLASHFNFGQYLIWHLSPRIRVGMDGRRETVYPDSVYLSYVELQRGRGDWDRHLHMGSPDLTLQFVDSPADNLLALDPGWEEVYQDSLVRMFVREGSPLKDRLAETPVPTDLPANGRGLCFP